MESLKIEQLRLSQENRKNFDPEKFKELVESIREKGIITPLLVRDVNTGVRKVGDAGYEIIAGERRFRAAKELKLKEVPVTVVEVSDEEAAQLRIIENLQREDVSPMDEAKEYERLSKQFGNTLEVIAAKVAKPLRYVKDRMKLLALAPEVTEALEAKKITMNHAVVISRLSEQKDQKKLLKNVTEYGNSASRTEQNLRDYLSSLQCACFDTKDCKACASNGAKQSGLFDESNTELLDGHCMDQECFLAKEKAWIDEKSASYAKRGQVGPGGRALPEYNPNPKCKKCKIGNGWIFKKGQYGNKACFVAACFDKDCYKKTYESERSSSSASSGDSEYLYDRVYGGIRAVIVKNKLKTAEIDETLALAIFMAKLCENAYNIPLKGGPKYWHKMGKQAILDAILKHSRELALELEEKCDEVLTILKINADAEIEITEKHLEKNSGIKFPGQFAAWLDKKKVKHSFKLEAPKSKTGGK